MWWKSELKRLWPVWLLALLGFGVSAAAVGSYTYRGRTNGHSSDHFNLPADLPLLQKHTIGLDALLSKHGFKPTVAPAEPNNPLRAMMNMEGFKPPITDRIGDWYESDLDDTAKVQLKVIRPVPEFRRFYFSIKFRTGGFWWDVERREKAVDSISEELGDWVKEVDKSLRKKPRKSL